MKSKWASIARNSGFWRGWSANASFGMHPPPYDQGPPRWLRNDSFINVWGGSTGWSEPSLSGYAIHIKLVLLCFRMRRMRSRRGFEPGTLGWPLRPSTKWPIRPILSHFPPCLIRFVPILHVLFSPTEILFNANRWVTKCHRMWKMHGRTGTWTRDYWAIVLTLNQLSCPVHTITFRQKAQQRFRSGWCHDRLKASKPCSKAIF